MRLGTVIGRVTLTQQEPVYRGGRLLLVQPWTRAQFAAAGSDTRPVSGALTAPLPPGSTVVVYDELGAGEGSVVGFTEGAEAAQPFTGDAPVDAYCACIVEQLSYHPPR
jgi:ethanolamine utilization protein EutN